MNRAHLISTNNFHHVDGRDPHVDLAAAPALWPLLWWASVLHVGKGASMGFGRIRLGGADSP
jgi:CRISPR/Cas system endoribonuclease Cas6 (RAMP superfamily)